MMLSQGVASLACVLGSTLFTENKFIDRSTNTLCLVMFASDVSEECLEG